MQKQPWPNWSFSLRNSFCFAIGIAFSIVVLRYVTLWLNTGEVPAHYAQGLLLSLVNEFAIACLLLAVLQKLQWPLAKAIVVIGIYLPLVFFYLICFHYEATFSRLPSANLLYYLRELDNLSSSIQHNIPLKNLLVEFGLFLLLISVTFALSQRYFIPIQGWVKSASITVAIFFLVVTHANPALVSDRYLWPSREPLVWFIQSVNHMDQEYQVERKKLLTLLERFKDGIGIKQQALNVEEKYSFCTTQKRYPMTKKNVIVLILEGVGRAQLNLYNGQQPLMTNLRRIGRENILFERAITPGTKSLQALLSIFSGLPAQTYQNLLWRVPLPNFNGFPKVLAQYGYHTGYFHGGDLSFEQQRSYLQAVGFQHISEYEPNTPTPVYGWGYSDGHMFNELRAWIDQQRQADKPYLAALFTLSTHDPYRLPDGWHSPFQVAEHSSTQQKFIASYHYLDEQLGNFYDWLKQADPNAVLVIVGDHIPHLLADNSGRNLDSDKFYVPMIFSTGEESRSLHVDQANRLVALHDIPSTVMGLLNADAHDCDLGLDILAKTQWPADRVVYAVAGDSFESMFLWQGEQRWHYDRLAKQLTPLSGQDGLSAEFIRSFIHAAQPANYYLAEYNAYFRPSYLQQASSRPTVSQPIFIAHRANTNGPNLRTENSRVAIESAIAQGIGWVEVDIQMTQDGVLILHHDETIKLNHGQQSLRTIPYDELVQLPGYEDILTLEQVIREFADKINLLLEIKPIQLVKDEQHAVAEIIRLTRHYPATKKFMIDSFQPSVISSIARHCDCETGFDAPFKKAVDLDLLTYVKGLGVDWIYLHHSVADASVIRLAHQVGLEVMIYTVNTVEEFRRFSDELPDGVISDNVALLQSKSTTQ